MRVAIIVLLWSVFMVGDGYSQILNYKGIPHATTFAWSERNRIQILDRSHAFGDGFSDRGFAAAITPFTTHEYEMDLMTYEYKFTDSFIWQEQGSGARSHFGSITKSRLSVFTDIYQEIELSNKSQFQIDAIIQEDARAKRAYFEFGYHLNLGENNRVALSHNFSEYKKDLDVTLSYGFEKPQFGRLGVGITAQNYMNNFVNGVGNTSSNRRRDIFEINYENTPLFITTRYQSPVENFWYLDISSGIQPNVISTERSSNDASYFMDQEESLYYFNSSLSLKVWKLVLGGYFYADYNTLYRESAANPFDGNYTSTQQLIKAGFFGYGYFKWFSPHIVLSLQEYSDRQTGTDFSFSIIPEELDYTNSRVLLDVGSTLNLLDSKLNLMFKYLSYVRRTPNDQRLIIRQYLNSEEFTYRFDNRFTFSIQSQPHEKIFFELGAGLDIDGDKFGKRRIFDKGFGKFLFEF